MIFSKSTQHTNCPKKTKAFRVENYWSVLTIKPFTSGKAFLDKKLIKLLNVDNYRTRAINGRSLLVAAP